MLCPSTWKLCPVTPMILDQDARTREKPFSLTWLIAKEVFWQPVSIKKSMCWPVSKVVVMKMGLPFIEKLEVITFINSSLSYKLVTNDDLSKEKCQADEKLDYRLTTWVGCVWSDWICDWIFRIWQSYIRRLPTHKSWICIWSKAKLYLFVGCSPSDDESWAACISYRGMFSTRLQFHFLFHALIRIERTSIVALAAWLMWFDFQEFSL